MPTAPTKRFVVKFSTVAASQLGELKARAAASPGSAEATFYDGVARFVTKMLPDPALVLDRRWALANHPGRDLRGIYRLKAGRLRLFYIASSTKRLAVVLLLGYRKQGDKADAYEVLSRRLAAGEFDVVFAEVGAKKPGG